MSDGWTGTRDPALLAAVTGEDPTGWQRDAVWCVRCACGHLDTSHRHDLKASSPCSTGGCGCQYLRPQAVLWREHRWVEGRLPDPS